jgi:hypothetical protein
VVPCRDPAKVTVAPNSPSARAKHSTVPDTSAGPSTGRVTRRSTYPGLAPRARAASSNRLSRLLSAPSTVITMKGRATNACARITATVENAMWMPTASSCRPTRPIRPKVKSRAIPPTTGGSTSGSSVSERRTDRPGNLVRAKTSAKGTPSSRQMRVATVAVSSDRRSAVSADSLVTSDQKWV